MPRKKKSKESLKLNRIKVVLVENGVSQLELAKKVKRDPNTISRICNNRNQPSVNLLYEIALALNVDPRNLLVPLEDVKEQLSKENK